MEAIYYTLVLLTRFNLLVLACCSKEMAQPALLQLRLL